MERKKIVVAFLVSIFLISFVSAFGVVSPYWEGKPLRISPGDTAVVNLGLQNLGTDEDLTVQASLKQGSEIASVPEIEYLVRAETKDTQVPVTITIPLNESLVGNEYVVTVSFRTVTEGEGISLGIGIDTTFDVIVTGTPKEEKKFENITLILIILSAIAVILVLIYIFRKKLFNKK